MQIFQIVDKIFRLIDNDNDGIASPEEILAFISNICNPRYNFDKLHELFFYRQI